MGPAAQPFPSLPGASGRAPPQGGECRAASSPSPGLGPPLCRHRRPVSNVEPGQASPVLIPTPRKASPAARWEDRLCGEGSTGATEDTGFPSSGAPAAPRGDSPREGPRSGGCPSPAPGGGRAAHRTAAVPPATKQPDTTGLKGPGRGPAVACARPTPDEHKRDQQPRESSEPPEAQGRGHTGVSLPPGLRWPSSHAQLPEVPKRTRHRGSVRENCRASSSQGCGRPFPHGHHQGRSGSHGACSLASAPTVGPRSQEHGPLVS